MGARWGVRMGMGIRIRRLRGGVGYVGVDGRWRVVALFGVWGDLVHA